MRHNGSRSPEEIEQEIARTRGDMDATLSALESRLTPGQLVDQGLDYLKQSGPKEFITNLGDSAKQNPLPIALVGIGLAWLMASGNRASGGYAAQPGGPGIGQRASELRGRAAEKVSSAKESLSSARDSLSQTAASARERVGQVGQSARAQAERMRSGYESLMREQPLALGAVGLAIGAVLAAAAPRTRKEDELMGEASERLSEKAKGASKEQLEKLQQRASPAHAGLPGQPERTEISATANVAPPAAAKDPRLKTP